MIVLILFCSIGWVSNSQIFLNNLYIILILSFVLTLFKLYKKHLLLSKFLIVTTLLFFYFYICDYNSFLDKNGNDLLINITQEKIDLFKDKVKSKYYEEIIKSIIKNEESMSLEV